MLGFADETYIDVASGNGGAGAVSFRREKYTPRGGPDGGDGGKGGDVVFSVKDNLKTLSHLKRKRVYIAENGVAGGKKKKHGKNGRDVIIHVPPGTIVKDGKTNNLLKDLTIDGKWIFLTGGIGGKGNWHFRSSTRQAPAYAQSGKSGESYRLHIELSLIADIGFVGFPNAGKSTLLSILTHADPKIADYPFTTKIPNLGVMQIGDIDLVLADIPGIIEGASKGAGLGIKFIKHISRTRALCFLIDMNDDNYLSAFNILKKELEHYSDELVNKQRIVIGTKLDLPGTEERLKELKKSLKDEKVLGISNITKHGIDMVKKEYFNFVNQ